jgi:tetratricopeptide (TPR) repeat protein
MKSRNLFALILALAFAGNLFAANVAADFSTANRLYADGKFSDAANAYENILQTGGQSPALLFNYANAEFKTGNLGKAIAAYRRAAQLSPRDSEIRANLDFVRNQVQGSAIRESRWEAWLGQLTLNEWTLLTSVAVWLTFLLLAAGQIRPVLGLKLKRVTTLFATLVILSGAALCVQAVNHFYKATAVVITNQATARSGPFDEAQTAFTVHDGAELPVLDRHDNWVQVADGSGKIGWLPSKQLETLPGA